VSRAATDRRARRLLLWYPKRWRARYGDEFTQLLSDDISDRPRSWHRTLDVAQSGLAVRVGRRPRASLGVFLFVLAAAAAVAAFVAAGTRSAGPPPVTVRADGRIGTLRINLSDRGQVIAFAGRPTSEVRGSDGPGLLRLDALYYGCYAPAGTTEKDFACKTIFWLDTRTKKLVAFWTRDPRYTTRTGVHVGTPTHVAEQAMRKGASASCGSGSLLFKVQHTLLVLYVSGPRIGPDYGGRITHLILQRIPDRSRVTNCQLRGRGRTPHPIEWPEWPNS
jgi:hypothetical protein